MEIDDLRALSDEDLDNELYDTHRELMNLRFRAATMQLSNVNEISSAKKRVARINTLIRERELTRAAV
ncbi:MAG: 50S ribosomal protein L29 [SAR202 cluster bacterium]|nr:50S ribosomal protein L29 [Chloroflexota bacterium]MDP6420700.1 50S ribosomal protein L29 [SAR202 cluster bacterium]HAL48633.1 50S ribosomal protein L29 [Dehalococcoidia bacterium]MDP6663783.1 50S ribosomal protein L29 [SAR202 cluster bacterium]MDP6798594.1 50S ribosomal protein L29 [SAR202 cluster bacterium]